jgi:hypothetical protein
MKKSLVFLFLVIVNFTLSAQVLNLSTDKAAFLDDYGKQLEKNLGTSLNKTNLAAFGETYKAVSDTEKDEIIGLLQAFSKKGFKPFELSIVSSSVGLYGKNVSPKTMPVGTFLKNIWATCNTLNLKSALDMVSQINNFLDKKILYTSNFNKVKADYTGLNFVYFDGKKDFFSTSTATPASSTKENEEEDLGWGEATKEEEYDPWKDASLEVKPKEEKDIVVLPKIQGLIAVFDKLDLILIGPSDSLSIKNTKGAYDFSTGTFIGEKGQFSWWAAAQQARASFTKFYVKSFNNKFIADRVLLDHEKLLKTPIEGVLELRIEKRTANQASTYPRFKSYKNDCKLALHQENIDYYGGYSLQGNTVSSSSMFDDYCKIVANKTSKNKFTVIGKTFFFTDSTIVSPRVSFITKIDKDSVTHQAIKMVYNVKNKHLQLNKLEKSGYKNSLYSDSFHQVDIKSDAMSWDLNAGGKLDFYIVAGKTEVPAVFESFDYYNPDRIRGLSTAAGFNPLIPAGNLVARKKQNVITLAEMENITKKEKFQVSNGMLIGHQMGFFDYNPYNNTYSLSRKGEHYFLSFMGKKDFDDLVLTSLGSDKNNQKNASIDLTDKSLDIKGTQDFKLSDSLGISFVPKDQSMKIIGNKVFSFNGLIGVKNFKFYGDFEVEYEKFLVKLKRIDSITFTPLADYKKGSKKMIGGNYLFGKTGLLYLNSPENKSGRKKLPEYPKLEIPGGVLVYFTEPGRKQKFSNSVFFTAPTIKIDSLNTVDPVYEGTFTFNEILKPIKENLVVMKDSTMGMNHSSNQAYTLYNSKSTLKAWTPIVLDGKGLKTSAELSHIVSNLKVKDLTLFENYAVGTGEEGRINEATLNGAYFPQVAIQDYNFYWDPKADSMAINSSKGFSFYTNSSLLKGNLLLKQKGLFGSGDLERKDAQISSTLYQFKESGFTAQNAKFSVKAAPEDTKAVFSGKKMGIDFNIKSSMVNFTAIEEDFNSNEKSQLEFPFSSYNTTIDKALWDIKAKTITMSGELERSYFSSTLPNQYGLKFKGTNALYAIDTKSLNITGVNEIHSADAAVIPPKGAVFINKEGLVEPFENAKIIADTLNRYHTLTKASVKINSKISFTGNATYQFVNVSADTFNIKLGNFEFAEILADGSFSGSKSSNKLNTVARAKIVEKDSLYLSPRILYKGEMTMLSPFKNLALNGLVLPDLKKYPMFGGSWITYKGNKSEAISINIDESLKDGGKPLYVGLHLRANANTDAIYPTFLSMKGSGDDGDVFSTRGIFKRQEEFKRFRVAPADSNEVGNTYDFYDDKGIIELDGKFNLLGAPTKVMETVGQAVLNVDSAKYRFSSLMRFDFPMSMPLVQKMGQNIVKANLDAGNSEPAIKPEEAEFIAKISQFTGKKEALSYLEKTRKEHVPLFKSAQSFLTSLVISDVNLIWSPKANAYISTSKIGISNMGDVDINAQVEGYIEIAKSYATGDEVNIYFDISPTKWYFFKYSGGQLSLTSSDDEVNKILSGAGTDGKDKKDKNANTVFMDTDMGVRFKKRFTETYLGLKEKPKTQVLPKAKDALPVDPKKPAKKVADKDDF